MNNSRGTCIIYINVKSEIVFKTYIGVHWHGDSYQKWNLNKIADCLQTCSSNALPWTKYEVVWFKFHIWSGKLAPSLNKVIPGTKHNLDFIRSMASAGSDGLISHSHQMVSYSSHHAVMFTFPTRIFYRAVPGFAIDCPCGVWCREFTTSPLYVGPLFGNLV